MFGTSGACVYEVARGTQPRTQAIVTAYLEGLARSSRPYQNGVIWPSPSGVVRLLINEALALHDEALATFLRSNTISRPGAAHGSAGVIAALTACVRFGCCTTRSTKILRLATTALTASCIETAEGKRMPLLFGLDRPQHQSGWCNGDLGVAVILYNSGRVLKHRVLMSLALELARREARQALSGKVRSPSNPALCHGHAGRAHLFNRLYQATGDRLLRRAALFALSECLRLRVAGSGVGGFVVVEDEKPPILVRGFLQGAAGIALALLAATGDTDSTWDQVLIGQME